jgi:SEC-C motif
MPARYIPANIRRELRQQAGFGCCVCGHPFIEYHHIEQYATAPLHDLRRMMALCPNHHHEATVGALTRDEQQRAKAAPWNVTRGFADGILKVNSRAIAVEAGTNLFVGAGFKFLVDGESLLSLGSDREGRLTLSIAVYDPADALQLLISENEWITGDPAPWDIEYAYNILKIRQKAGAVALDIDARNLPVRLRGMLRRKRQEYLISPSALSINGVVQNVKFMDLGLVATELRADTAAGTFEFGPHPLFQAAAIVSDPDPAERLRKSLETYQTLVRKARLGKNAPCLCGSGRRFKSCCGD